MRSFALVLMTPLLACSAPVQHVDSLSPDAQTEPDPGPPPPAFQIVSHTVTVADGEESMYCYYFRTRNTGQLAIQRWTSHMPAAVHDIVLFLTPNDLMTPDTQTSTRCGIADRTMLPLWTYSADTADAEAQLPADDGTGQPIAQLIKANQSGFLQIHYLNTTGSAVQAQVEVNAFAYDDNLPVTWTLPFVTSRTNFEIGPTGVQPTTASFGGSCPVPLDDSGHPVKFFQMTTHTYKQGVHTAISDGATPVFTSTNWSHPGAASWPAPFYSFKNTMLSYQCDYSNSNPYTIVTGDDPTLDELCMSINFYVPANPTTPPPIGHYCLDSATVY